MFDKLLVRKDLTMLDCYQEVEQLTKELVGIQSINCAPGEETAIARYICDWYQ